MNESKEEKDDFVEGRSCLGCPDVKDHNGHGVSNGYYCCRCIHRHKGMFVYRKIYDPGEIPEWCPKLNNDDEENDAVDADNQIDISQGGLDVFSDVDVSESLSAKDDSDDSDDEVKKKLFLAHEMTRTYFIESLIRAGFNAYTERLHYEAGVLYEVDKIVIIVESDDNKVKTRTIVPGLHKTKRDITNNLTDDDKDSVIRILQDALDTVKEAKISEEDDDEEDENEDDEDRELPGYS